MDAVDEKYHDSPDGQAWPQDAPLTKYGIHLARNVADELEALHNEVHFMAIATSPYRRCMQTAAEIAKTLDLPVLIDQELGEIRDRSMAKDSWSHRSPRELQTMAAELGVKLLNPRFRRGGLKLFGKRPPWPETLEAAKRRFIVRIENYIRQSADTQRNMILVTHADALAGALVMFEREGVHVQQVEFCGRIVARRTVGYLDNGEGSTDHKIQPDMVKRRLCLTPAKGIYADAWSVECRSICSESVRVEALDRYHERHYLDTCAATQKLCQERDLGRTKSDDLFQRTLRRLSTCEDSNNLARFCSECSIGSSGYASSNPMGSILGSSDCQPSRRSSRSSLGEQDLGCFQVFREGFLPYSNALLKRCLCFLGSGGQRAAGAAPGKLV